MLALDFQLRRRRDNLPASRRRALIAPLARRERLPAVAGGVPLAAKAVL